MKSGSHWNEYLQAADGPASLALYIPLSDPTGATPPANEKHNVDAGRG